MESPSSLPASEVIAPASEPERSPGDVSARRNAPDRAWAILLTVLGLGVLAAAAVIVAELSRIGAPAIAHAGDRKSTRLNSSHVSISYAVFCLKKKKAWMRAACRQLEAD